MHKIMLVDDEAIITTSMEDALVSFGYNIVGVASSGQESIGMAKRLKPDLILMDIVMPGKIDGIDASKEILKEIDVPVIFLTAHSDETFIKRVKDTSPYGYILKPASKNAIKAAVEIAIDKHKKVQELHDSNEKYRSAHEKVAEEMKKKNAELEALYHFDKKMTSFVSAKELLPLINEQMTKLLDTDASIYWKKEDNYLVLDCSSTKGGMELMIDRDRIKIGEGLAGLAAKENRPVFVSDNYYNDPSLTPEQRVMAVQYGFKSALNVPICMQDQVVGVLTVLSIHPTEFTGKDIKVLNASANYLALSIEKARLLGETIEGYSQLKAIYEVNKMIASELKKDELLPRIAEQADRLLGANGCAFWLIKDGELVPSCAMSEAINMTIKKKLTIGESLIGIVAKEKEPVAVENIQTYMEDTEEHRNAAMKFGFVSFLGVPLLIKNKVIGVVSVYTKNQRKFTERDIYILRALADQAAIFIENSQNLSNLKREICKLKQSKKQ